MVMGILNVTPDSFADGGQFLDPNAALRYALKMAAEGAEIIDVGGESTRPFAPAVTEAEECRRVLPVIERLVPQVKIPISIDTQKPAVARAALAAGASIVNDIAANRADPVRDRLVAETGAGYVAMHMQATPQTMQIHPTYQDVVAEVGDFFADRLDRLKEAGVNADQVVFDVGIGFGKTLEHNLRLLAGLKCFKNLQRPLLLGVSRKSFINRLLGVDLPDRLPASLACAGWAVAHGVQILRVHDVAATVQALRMTEAIIARIQ